MRPIPRLEYANRSARLGRGRHCRPWFSFRSARSRTKRREGQNYCPRFTDVLGVGLNTNTTGLIHPTVGFIGALTLDSHLDLVDVLPFKFASIRAVHIGEYPYPRDQLK